MRQNSQLKAATRFPAAPAEKRDTGVPWLGRIPAHWRVVRVGLVGAVLMGRQRAPQHEKGNYLRPYLRVANVLDGTIDYSDVLEMNFELAEQRVFGLENGDILLNEGQSRELVGRSAVYRGESGAYCFQNTLIRFRVHEDLDPDFVQTQFASWLSLGAFQLFSRQSTNIAHLGADRLAQMHMAVPPLDEQRAVVRYIKVHTRQIDALVAAKQRVLDLLAERRKAIIATAVTLGLDPKMKLRDSGKRWLGEIPAHWPLVPLRYLVSFLSGGTPDKGNADFWSGGTIPWVSPKDMKVERIDDSEDHITEAAVDGSATRIVPIGSVLVVVRGMILAHTLPVAVTTAPVTINQDIKALVCHEKLLPGFLRIILVGQSRRLLSLTDSSAHGTKKLETEVLQQLEAPAPGLSEQQAIVDHITRETAKLDAVRTATEQTIALLKERRAALIGAAVTGQINVRTAA